MHLVFFVAIVYFFINLPKVLYSEFLVLVIENMYGRILGASHLREIFYRMGLSDKDIVTLSRGTHY